MTSETSDKLVLPDILPQVSDAELAPIKPSQRIDAMDILRGFALIGILLMNIEWFNRPVAELGISDRTLSGLDHAVGWLIRCFVEGKFYKLFALLFGMGFAVMLNSAIKAGKPFGAWFVRRMVVLFIIGVLHMVLLWEGDILHDYAFAGLMFLALIYLLRTKRLQKYNHASTFLKLGLWWLLLPLLISIFVGIGFSLTHDPQTLSQQWQKKQVVLSLVDQLKQQSNVAALTAEADDTVLLTEDANAEPLREYQSEQETAFSSEQEAQAIIAEYEENQAELAKELAALKDGNYWQATQFRAEKSIDHLLVTPAFTLVYLLPLFLLGYWLISTGIMAEYKQQRQLFTGLRRIGLGIGLFVSVAGLLIMDHPAAQHFGLLQLVGSLLFNLGEFFMAAGYLGLILSLLLLPPWYRLIAYLAPLGRMALSNYLSHSLILTSLFYGYAGGLYGEVSRAAQVLIVIAIIGLQIPLSILWLRYYRFGPMEWLWRSLSYKKWQPFKIQRIGS